MRVNPTLDMLMLIPIMSAHLVNATMLLKIYPYLVRMSLVRCEIVDEYRNGLMNDNLVNRNRHDRGSKESRDYGSDEKEDEKG